MNSGVISSRYANALLQLVLETGRGDQVYAQVSSLLRNPDGMSEMTLEPDLESLVRVVINNGRAEYLRYIFHSFCMQYNARMGRKRVMVSTAVPMDGLEEKIRPVLERELKSDIIFESSVDPALIGGFRLAVEDYLLDASVRRQIDDIRRQLMEKNRRIV